MCIRDRQYASDVDCFVPLMEKFNRQYGRYPEYPVADAGYGSPVSYTHLDVYKRQDHRLAMSNRTTARTGAALVNEDAEAWMKLSCNWLWNHFE